MVDLATTQKQYLNVDEVMEIFGVCRRTVYYWFEKGRVIGVSIGGGGIRISVADLRRLVQAPCAFSDRHQASVQSYANAPNSP